MLREALQQVISLRALLPSEIVQKWQEIVNLLAEIIHVPAALVMKLELPNIKVFVSSESSGRTFAVLTFAFGQPAEAFAGFICPLAFLEAMAMAYQTGQRPDDALKSWQELYDVAQSAGFTLAAAEAAFEMAGIYSSKKDPVNAISYYSLAEKGWKATGNTARRIDALTSEASLLFQQGEGDKSVQIDEELLPLQKSSKNSTGQFITDLAMAEILQPKGDLDRRTTLKDAEICAVSGSLTLPNVEPKLVLELYGRECDLADKQGILFKHLSHWKKPCSLPALLSI